MKQRLNVTIDMDVYVSAKAAGLNISQMVNEILKGLTMRDKVNIEEKTALLEEIESHRKEMNIIQQQIAEKAAAIANIDSQVQEENAIATARHKEIVLQQKAMLQSGINREFLD